ncbi:MAG: response regulator [Sporomusaceae bacterium]|nr:response regulator [Sporomusaceae bacterium]
MMNALKVLIVEDDPLVADINRRFTEAVEGFAIVGIASDGKQALDMIAAEKPDLILLDVYMPHIDGVEVLTLIRKQEVPVDVILITAASDGDTISKIIRSGVVDYLIKPFKFERFRTALESYRDFQISVQGKQAFSQKELDKFLVPKVIGKDVLLPKNLQQQTLKSIEEFLISQHEPQSAEDVAEKVGISRVTARRYLEYFVQEGRVSMILDYLPLGRPIHRYQIR